MAKKGEQRIFNVAVVGLSGTEREKGDAGVGKSCLCNRFINPLEDEYNTDHISVLSQSDFGGRVVNNDHFLYWGEVVKTTDEGANFTFRVIEQTEFVDDSSFLPFKSGKTEPYVKRCAAAKVSSAEKLMYICKNQLGLEHEYEQKLLPDGKLAIDGFICVYDVGQVSGRSQDKQFEFATSILNNIMKTKKPVVLATTKNEECFMAYVREAEKLVAKREYKGMMIPIIETSSHDNVNVESAFITVAHLIDKAKGRTRIINFADASKSRKEVLDVAKAAYQSLIKTQVPDYKVTWIATKKIFMNNPDYQHFVELFGMDKAKRLFNQHILKLRNEYTRQKERTYLNKLPGLLQMMLPDLATIDDRSWTLCHHFLHNHDDFDEHFIDLGEDVRWTDDLFLDSDDDRIPFDWLESSEAETCFKNHVNALQAEHRRIELCERFRQMLEENPHVTPGKQLSEVTVFYLGKECYESLSETDRRRVFVLHQQALRDKAKHNFHELLLERADIFARFDPPDITMEDLEKIMEELQDEPRYKVLNRLEEDRKVMILNHLGFIQLPSKERCAAREHCAEVHIENALNKHAKRPESWNRHSQWLLDADDSQLNLVLLGSEGLADGIIPYIRRECTEDEYSYEDSLYSLDYRSIDGDVSLPQNSFRTQDFTPQGCVCVYHSHDTLEYLQVSLEKTLLSNLEEEDRLPFQGLPVVIVLAYDASNTDKGLMVLREEGQQLADRLQCPFIDVQDNLITNEAECFHSSQITKCLEELLKCIRHRASLVNMYPVAENIEPDIRVTMCIMCADPYSVELIVGPLLNHQCCYVTSEKYPTISLETYLDDCKRKVEVMVTSYHGASSVRDDLCHGYILVYSAKRKASFSTLRAFCDNIPSEVPLQLLAVTDSGGANAFFTSEFSQGLITEGNALADALSSRFMTTSTNFQQQTAVYNPFFKEAFDRRYDTESYFNSAFSADELSRTELSEKMMENRPPATLPKPTRGQDKRGSSNSQSTEDSEETFYDQLNYPRYHSDSEHDRSLSASPTLHDYSRVNNNSYRDAKNDEHVVFPSQIKQRINMFQGSNEEGQWIDNDRHHTVPKDQRLRPPIRPKPLNMQKYGKVSNQLQKTYSQNRKPSAGYGQAPIAQMELVEIGDYAMVADAVSNESGDYALVQDALPPGKFHRIRSTVRHNNNQKGGTDSDSEFSSLERKENIIYPRVHRRPTPHKKYKHKPKLSVWPDNEGDELQPPPLPPYPEEVLLQPLSDKQRLINQSASDGSEGSVDENVAINKKTKKRRSFRSKKKKEEMRSPSLSSYNDTTQLLPTEQLRPEQISYEEEHPYEEISELRDEYDDAQNKMQRKQREKELEKMRRKIEKKARDNEKKKQKEEERRLKEQQKLQRKSKKKDMKASSPWTLQDYVQTEGQLVPMFVEMCIKFVEEEGLLAEGIYRVPGNRAHVDLLLSKFSEDRNLDLAALEIPVNAIATALKGFFSDLGEPVIPNYLYDELIEAAVQHGSFWRELEPGIPDKSGRLCALRGVLKKLPPVNHEVLKYLVSHLHKVTDHSQENSMDSKNLAICWWPTLLRPEFSSFEKMASVSKYLEEIVFTLISQVGFLFYNLSEVTEV